MGKDPAVLFYTSDFLTGTEFFTFEQKGQYIQLLCVQHQNGHLPTDYMLKILGSESNPVWKKFTKDDQGLWYQNRMESETKRRKEYSESRRKNISNRYVDTYEGDMKPHMETDTETTTKDVSFANIEHFETVWKLYPNRQGKKHAIRHFLATVKTEKDFNDIQTAVRNYLRCDRVKNGYIQNGSTWFNDWQSWIEPTETMMKGNNGTVKKSTPSSATERAQFRHTEQQIKNNESLLESLRHRDRERGKQSGLDTEPAGNGGDISKSKVSS